MKTMKVLFGTTVRVDEQDLLYGNYSFVALLNKQGKRYLDTMSFTQREARGISAVLDRQNIVSVINQGA